MQQTCSVFICLNFVRKTFLLRYEIMKNAIRGRFKMEWKVINQEERLITKESLRCFVRSAWEMTDSKIGLVRVSSTESSRRFVRCDYPGLNGRNINPSLRSSKQKPSHELLRLQKRDVKGEERIITSQAKSLSNHTFWWEVQLFSFLLRYSFRYCLCF